MASTTTTSRTTTTSPSPTTTTAATSSSHKKAPVLTAQSATQPSVKSESINSSSTEKTARRVAVDKVRTKWEQATFGKSAQSVTLEEHVKNLTSPSQEVRRASAERLQYFQPEALRAISKILLTVASSDSDTWTATYAYRAYLRQLKEKELKIHPTEGSTS
jgi:hypothetical protein